jgi:phenylpropionate dioxygenase-like ring-hydroxylating dioxygenase large terminal subunit
MFIRNAWYVGAWSTEIRADTLLRRVILGEPILFYRSTAGSIVAMEDRCPHRHAPLSMGRHEGDCVRCMYHGLKFDPSGACVEVPGEEVAPRLKVRTYPALERDALVWIWMGEAERATPAALHSLPWLVDPTWARKPGYLHFAANYLLIVDNLLDFSHLAFLHEKTLGNAGQGTLRPTIDRIEGGLRVTRWSMNDVPAPFHTRVGGLNGRVDRWNIYQWYPPSTLIMDAGAAPAGQGAERGNRAGAIQFRHLSVQTPETESSTHYFFTHARDFRIEDDEVTDKMHAEVIVAFEEDRRMIEAQQANIALNPGAKMNGIGHDFGLNQARFLIERALRADRDAAATMGQPS